MPPLLLFFLFLSFTLSLSLLSFLPVLLSLQFSCSLSVHLCAPLPCSPLLVCSAELSEVTEWHWAGQSSGDFRPTAAHREARLFLHATIYFIDRNSSATSSNSGLVASQLRYPSALSLSMSLSLFHSDTTMGWACRGWDGVGMWTFGSLSKVSLIHITVQ